MAWLPEHDSISRREKEGQGHQRVTPNCWNTRRSIWALLGVWHLAGSSEDVLGLAGRIGLETLAKACPWSWLRVLLPASSRAPRPPRPGPGPGPGPGRAQRRGPTGRRRGAAFATGATARSTEGRTAATGAATSTAGANGRSTSARRSRDRPCHTPEFGSRRRHPDAEAGGEAPVLAAGIEARGGERVVVHQAVLQQEATLVPPLPHP